MTSDRERELTYRGRDAETLRIYDELAYELVQSDFDSVIRAPYYAEYKGWHREGEPSKVIVNPWGDGVYPVEYRLETLQEASGPEDAAAARGGLDVW